MGTRRCCRPGPCVPTALLVLLFWKLIFMGGFVHRHRLHREHLPPTTGCSRQWFVRRLEDVDMHSGVPLGSTQITRLGILLERYCAAHGSLSGSIVYRAERTHGLGNRLHGVGMALTLALATNRRLLVEWAPFVDGDCNLPGWLAWFCASVDVPLGTLLERPGFEWDRGAGGGAAVSSGGTDSCTDFSVGPCDTNVVELERLGNVSQWPNCLRTSAYYNYVPQLQRHPDIGWRLRQWFPQRGRRSSAPIEPLSVALGVLMRPASPEVQHTLRAYDEAAARARGGWNSTIAVHLRTSDETQQKWHEPLLNCAARQLVALARAHPHAQALAKNLALLVVSDTHDAAVSGAGVVRARARLALPRRPVRIALVEGSMCATRAPGRGGCLGYGRSSPDGIQAALLDILLLGRSGTLVKSYSSFSGTAACAFRKTALSAMCVERPAACALWSSCTGQPD